MVARTSEGLAADLICPLGWVAPFVLKQTVQSSRCASSLMCCRCSPHVSPRVIRSIVVQTRTDGAVGISRPCVGSLDLGCDSPRAAGGHTHTHTVVSVGRVNSMHSTHRKTSHRDACVDTLAHLLSCGCWTLKHNTRWIGQTRTRINANGRE